MWGKRIWRKRKIAVLLSRRGILASVSAVGRTCGCRSTNAGSLPWPIAL
jgi:hypothetical protein